MVINRSRHVYFIIVLNKIIKLNFQFEMFLRGKPFFRLTGFQKVIHRFQIHRCQSHTPGLDSHLNSIANSSPNESYSQLFFDKEVQQLLKKISNIDLQKIFKAKPKGEELNPPSYKLLNDKDLAAEMRKAHEKADYLLQIPPLINVTEDDIKILDSDTSLDGYDVHHSKHVFIDISPDETNFSRTVVVREPNGFLRTASKDERFRMNQIYNPSPGREIETPEMFETEHLMNVIKRKEYEFILDRACAQFEPDDLMYHKVITLTYEAINFCKDFEMLHSTRHFGSLAFYLVTHKNIDAMLDDNIQNGRIDDAFSLVKLYHKIHPHCKSAELSTGKSDIEILRDFINLDSSVPSILNKSLETYLSEEKNKNETDREIKKAQA